MGAKPQTDDTAARTVAVLGGGLAGLAASQRLLSAGYDVTLVEKRPFLGGRAFSFYDPQSGAEVDNGQHIFMGCCTYYMQFLDSIGTLARTVLQDRLEAEVFLDGMRGVLSSTPWLGPLHLVPAFVRYPHLGPVDKLMAVYALMAARSTDRVKLRDLLDSQTFYRWLKDHRQTERAIDNLWNLIILPTLNDDARHVSADMGLMVLQEGLLKRPSDASIGVSRIGLTPLAGEPGGRFLVEHGAKLVTGKSVRSIRVESGVVDSVELSDGSSLRADRYVSALPFDALLEALPRDVAGGVFFAGISELTSSPIVGVHLWYDRPIMGQKFVAFLDSPVQWVFNRSAIEGSSGDDGQHVCISVSGAWEYVDRPKEDLRELFSSEMERLFPAASTARIERSLIVKQPRATFRCVPGSARLRPSQKTPIPNLFLAGEWTDTGWPSTMEGAVRSGVYAADALMSSS